MGALTLTSEDNARVGSIPAYRTIHTATTVYLILSCAWATFSTWPNPAATQIGDKNLPKTNPWHSIMQNVHHDNTTCTEGINIETYYLRQGTGGKTLCQHCARLDREGR